MHSTHKGAVDPLCTSSTALSHLPCSSGLWRACPTLASSMLLGRLPHIMQCMLVTCRLRLTELGVGAQIWSIVVGLPLCAVGGVFYSWASGQTLVDGFVNAYGALYKIPGGPHARCRTRQGRFQGMSEEVWEPIHNKDC